jgi:hypothetical protein
MFRSLNYEKPLVASVDLGQQHGINGCGLRDIQLA